MKNEQEIENFEFFVSVDEIKRIENHKFELIASKSNLIFITTVLKLLKVKSAKMEGYLKLESKNMILLNAKVTSKLIQPCSITLDPVIINIRKNIKRNFLIKNPENNLNKVQRINLTRESFNIETIYSKINLAEILMETISLETPDYPKRAGVSLTNILGEKIDHKNNPFSVLNKLKKNL